MEKVDIKRLFVNQLNWELINTPLEKPKDFSEDVIDVSLAFQTSDYYVVWTVLKNLTYSNQPKNIFEAVIKKHKKISPYILFLFSDEAEHAITLVGFNAKGKTRKLKFDTAFQKTRELFTAIPFFDADEIEGTLHLKQKLDKVFDKEEKLTKKFYKVFNDFRKKFEQGIKGITKKNELDWYISVLLNRLMFIYFLQKKHDNGKAFLNNDILYLENKLDEIDKTKKNFYSDFLLPLFFKGFAIEKKDRTEKERKLLGNIPYLNGGLFLPHPIEKKYSKKFQSIKGELLDSDAFIPVNSLLTRESFENKDFDYKTVQIKIDNNIFKELLDYFGQWSWYLDDRELKDDNEINPDILGYIFDRYINQKQMGAYYTKEDITGYIARNTVIPALMDRLHHFIGLNKIKVFLEDPNKLITENKDPVEYLETWLDDLKTPLILIHQLYFKILPDFTILDPSVGSGAFLFAVIKILKRVYEALINRMRLAVQTTEKKFSKEFNEEITKINECSSEEYFINKTITLKNLHGVDIVPEATEICKLRLFLNLVAHIDISKEKIEALPDIDFNIFAGNTLVGFTKDEFTKISQSQNKKGEFGFSIAGNLGNEISKLAKELEKYKQIQLAENISKGSKFLFRSRESIKKSIEKLNRKLNEAMLLEYGYYASNKAELEKRLEWFKMTYQPFHFCVDFYDIMMKKGGFDVVLGNPPYVEFSKVKAKQAPDFNNLKINLKETSLAPNIADLKYFLLSKSDSNYSRKSFEPPTSDVLGYETLSCGNLYAFFIERSFNLLKPQNSRFGMIVPLSVFSTQRMSLIKDLFYKKFNRRWISYFGWRPSKLFEGSKKANRSLSIMLSGNSLTDSEFEFTTTYMKWYSEERKALFNTLNYIKSERALYPFIIPKLGFKIEKSIYKKFFAHSKTIKNFASNIATENIIYYRNTGGLYWKIFTSFKPEFCSSDGRSSSSRETHIYFRKVKLRDISIAIYNSNLYWWYYTIHSNCRDNNPFDVNSIPVTDEIMNDEGLRKLGINLMLDFQNNAISSSRTHKQEINSSFQEFNPSKSKLIIDEIDKILAKHYGFTDEELDFIINYDIRFRLGKDSTE